jgi:hypothetical protein
MYYNQELVLTVTPKPTKHYPVVICSGETYKWAVNGTDYVSGTYLVTNDGCKLLQRIGIDSNSQTNQSVSTVTICSGETYKWL